MNRVDRLLTYCDTSRKGLEIAPYFNPSLRKSDGYDVVSLDVFDTETLRAGAAKDPQIPDRRIAEIEDVDIVGDACSLGELVDSHGLAGQLSFVISSHNFEHLADPVKFLRGAAHALETGGVLSMAIPDYRCCFDHFRLPTRLADWLVAYHSGPSQPSAAIIFDDRLHRAGVAEAEPGPYSTSLGGKEAPPAYLKADIAEQYDRFLQEFASPGAYKDSHCSVLFPELFEAHLRDLRQLGLVDLDVIEISPTVGHEFMAHLRKVDHPSNVSAAAHRQKRQELLTRVNQEIGFGGFNKAANVRRYETLERILTRFGTTFFGKTFVSAVQDWNNDRIARRRARKAAALR